MKLIEPNTLFYELLGIGKTNHNKSQFLKMKQYTW